MQSLAILKALGDESRLGIFRLLLEREAHSEVIAERLKLAPSTVSFHLKKLTAAGLVSARRDQYYTFYEAIPKIAKLSLKDLVLEAGIKIQEQDRSEVEYKTKVLKSFFKYGRLIKIPTQKMKRQWVMEKVAESLQANKSYSISDAEVILSEIFEDTAAVIKELQVFGFVDLSHGKIKRLQQ